MGFTFTNHRTGSVRVTTEDAIRECIRKFYMDEDPDTVVLEMVTNGRSLTNNWGFYKSVEGEIMVDASDPESSYSYHGKTWKKVIL